MEEEDFLDPKEALDKLMGKSRNTLGSGLPSVHDKHFSDPDICKNYICGLCPHDLFTTIKVDLGKGSRSVDYERSYFVDYGNAGPCKRVHDDNMRAMFANLLRLV
jgi:hypothetical protein